MFGSSSALRRLSSRWSSMTRAKIDSLSKLIAPPWVGNRTTAADSRAPAASVEQLVEQDVESLGRAGDNGADVGCDDAVLPAHLRLDDVRDGAQDRVARLVAIAVVHLLEVVDVGEDQRDRSAEALDPPDL